MMSTERTFLYTLALLLPCVASAQSDRAQAPDAPAALVAEGSTPTYRNNADGAIGQVYIYTGGTFPLGTLPTELRFLWDFEGPADNTTGFLTPLLFEESVSGEYTLFRVVGIGKAFPVRLQAGPAAIPIDIVVGSRVTLNRRTTFGFVNGLVDANGIQYGSTAGTVDYVGPQDGGTGVGGPGTTNYWGATYQPYPPRVSLGITFGVSGSGATYPFYSNPRTYSAEALGYLTAP